MPDDTRMNTLLAELTALLDRHNATIGVEAGKAVITLWTEDGEECDWADLAHGPLDVYPDGPRAIPPEWAKPRAAENQWVRYLRNSDETTVWGRVDRVYDAQDSEGSKTYGGASIFDNAQLRGEPFAYRLTLSDEDAARVGHPVVIAGSRIVAVDNYGPKPEVEAGGDDA